MVNIDGADIGFYDGYGNIPGKGEKVASLELGRRVIRGGSAGPGFPRNG